MPRKRAAYSGVESGGAAFTPYGRFSFPMSFGCNFLRRRRSIFGEGEGPGELVDGVLNHEVEGQEGAFLALDIEIALNGLARFMVVRLR